MSKIPEDLRTLVEVELAKPNGNPQGLTIEDTAQLIYLLRKLDRKKGLGTLIFNEIARHSISVAIEFVAFRENPQAGRIEVFIAKRGADELWPGQTHAPGTIIRAGERIKKAFNRLARKEGVSAKSVKFAGVVYVPEDQERGSGLSLVFAVEAQDVGVEAAGRKWISVNEALADTSLHYAHKSIIIPLAMAAAGIVDLAEFKRQLYELHGDGTLHDFEQEFSTIKPEGE